MFGLPDIAAALAQVGDLIPTGTRVDVFQQIYQVFLVLGTLVGVVVIGYMVYNAYTYRDTEDAELDDPPRLGELPSSGGKGRKLFLSFALSAIIVISLIVWTYGTLLFVEGETVAAGTSIEDADYEPGDDAMTVMVEGYQFGWRFTYPNGATYDSGANDPLRIPAGVKVNVVVTSSDVHHNFWVPGLRAKADAIPGQRTTTWLEADSPGEYRAACAELCGAGHSYMDAQVVAMEESAFNQWYTNQTDQ